MGATPHGGRWAAKNFAMYMQHMLMPQHLFTVRFTRVRAHTCSSFHTRARIHTHTYTHTHTQRERERERERETGAPLTLQPAVFLVRVCCVCVCVCVCVQDDRWWCNTRPVHQAEDGRIRPRERGGGRQGGHIPCLCTPALRHALCRWENILMGGISLYCGWKCGGLFKY